MLVTRDYLAYCYRGYRPHAGQSQTLITCQCKLLYIILQDFADDLSIQEDHGGQTKYLGVCKPPGEGRKVDLSIYAILCLYLFMTCNL